MKNIIYFGDSYCASYQLTRPTVRYDGVVFTPSPTHLNHVANDLDLRLYPYGYAGRAWFYSRSQLMRTLMYYPDLINDTELAVFFHTDSYRFNTTNPEISTGLGTGHFDDTTEFLVEPFVQWQKYLMDAEFQEWAQLSWFKELNELFLDVKQIHFTAFEASEHNLNSLRGMVYHTPLLNLSIGELTGTDEEIINQITTDRRHNHFSTQNNRALANMVIDAYNNYNPGHYEIDTSKFELVNPNAHKYPKPGFGTR